MYIEKIINEISEIVLIESDNFELYTKIKKILENIDLINFNSEIKSYNYKNIIEIKNSNDSYIKYILESNNNFDIVYIKWDKNSFTKIHDHPEKGCIVKILSGLLFEECYDNNNLLNYKEINLLTSNMISYKIGKTILHKITTLENSESLHIYIPGKYCSKNYSMISFN